MIIRPNYIDQAWAQIGIMYNSASHTDVGGHQTWKPQSGKLGFYLAIYCQPMAISSESKTVCYLTEVSIFHRYSVRHETTAVQGTDILSDF